jgi:hypothetical protein
MIFYGGLFVVERLLPAYSDTLAVVLFLVAITTAYLVARSMPRLSKSVLASLEYPSVDPSRILILRTTADEAAAALGATHVISWVAGRIWLITSRALGRTLETVEVWRDNLKQHWLLTALVAACLIAVCGGALLHGSGVNSPAVGLPALSLLLLVATLARGGLAAALFGRIVFAIAAVPFLVPIALLGISVGPELLIAGLLFQVTAETTPPGRWVVWQVAPGTGGTRDTEKAPLMHSASYQDPGALEILGQWMSTAEQRAELAKQARAI